MAPIPKRTTDDEQDKSFNEDRLEALIKLQEDFLARAKRGLVNLPKDGSRKTARIYYTTKLTALGSIVTEFETNHREIVTLVSSSERSQLPYFTTDIPTAFEDAQIAYLTALQTECDEKFPDTEPPRTKENRNHLSSTGSLPPVAIPKFSGLPAEWKTFRDLFSSIVHKNERLPGSHKFQYLLGALSGEARDVVSGFEVCDDDYLKAWQALCKVYNDKPAMFMHTMSKFTSLEPVSKEHPERLRELVKATASCLKSLEGIGFEREKIDSVITYSLIRKLPTETVAYWEETRDRSKFPLFDEIKTCVDTRIRVASVIATIRSGSSGCEARAGNSNHQQNQQTNPTQTKKKVNTYHTTNSKATAKAPSGSSTTTTASTVSSKGAGKRYNCPVCDSEGHPVRMCDKFLALSPVQRRATIDKLDYCANCFAFNHRESKCGSPRTCYTCGERHHTLLHGSDGAHRTAAHHVASSPDTSRAQRTAYNARNEFMSTSNVLLATAIVTVLDVHGDSHSLRALIDQGSEANFITEAAVTALQLPKTAAKVTISGIGATSGQSNHFTTLTLKATHHQSFTLTVEALVLSRITNLLPAATFKPKRWEHIIDLTLADPSYYQSRRIDLVLGADVLAQILMEGIRTGPVGSPIAQQTQFGWILSGKFAPESENRLTVTALHATLNLEALMEKFLASEAVDDASPLTLEEQWCENFFVNNHRRDKSGRFHVNLPFRFLLDPTTSPLGRSRDIAIKSLVHLERRFRHDPHLKEEYSKAINEYLTSGRMQPTTSTEVQCDGLIRSAYLPHHAVIKESSTSTKLRVVFDGSRKTTSGKSLNEMLVVGPTIQNDIITIILNWRFHRIGCIADVQKMYLQVEVEEQDIQYQRIVWRNDPSEEFQDFAMNRLTFGTSCAPFLAIRSVNQLAEEERSNYPEAALAILNDAYVDDVITGGDDIPTVQNLQRELSEMMKSGGFDLKKWASNANEVLEKIPEGDREVKVPVELNANDTIKALGIAWNPATDSIGFKTSLDPVEKYNKITKRTALSIQAKLFDPIGLIAPIVVIAKIFMKKTWAAELDWDDELPSDLRNDWIHYIDSLQRITDIRVPRWINTCKRTQSVELHGFCDASAVAYGAAIYLRLVDGDNIVHAHLITSKSKVAPAQTLTIPRLELCGAHLLADLVVSTRKRLRHANIAPENIHLWCDSEIVCFWLRSKKSLKVYVQNRVSKIREATNGMRWRHVRTHDNPADLVSRGASPTELVDNSLWWHGPPWLRLSQEEWPINRIDNEPPKDVDLELRRCVQTNLCTKHNDIVHRFSSFNRLIRATALCQRYLHNLRYPTDRIQHPRHRIKYSFTSDELKRAQRYWILQSQKEFFNDELFRLSKSPPANIDNKSKLLSLAPFVDGNGLLRVRGRLEHSTLAYDEKHPVILPPNAHFTMLLIDRYHLRAKHGGAQLLMALIRRHFWIVNARNAIRFRIHKCLECYRHRAETSKQLMGSLPPARVQRSVRPFLHTGIDYCGPFDLRASKGRGIKSYKSYIAVFVCLTVRAIHIECVDGLTTDAFLAAFRRFVARRGLPSDVYSDNGTNFVGAANKLEREFDQLRRDAEEHTSEKYIDENIQWHFIPPASPHFGGLWEAGVKSVKFHLRRIVGESKLTYEEMHTLLCQIEACLNSRPLYANSNDPNDLTALTPGHFLINTDLLSVPEPSVLEVRANRLDHWEQIQQMRQFFWKRWRSDYLAQLQQRPKWCREQPNLKIGDMVLVADDRYSSSKWPLGRIVDTHPGTDSHVRVVTVRTADGTYKRNITRICRLPINDEDATYEANQNIPNSSA